MSAYLGTRGWQAFEDFYARINKNTFIWSSEHKRRLLSLKRRAVRKTITSDWSKLIEELLSLQEEALGIRSSKLETTSRERV
jgi:hypothetical protein